MSYPIALPDRKFYTEPALSRNARLLYVTILAVATEHRNRIRTSMKELCVWLSDVNANGVVKPAGYRLVRLALDEIKMTGLVKTLQVNEHDPETGNFTSFLEIRLENRGGRYE